MILLLPQRLKAKMTYWLIVVKMGYKIFGGSEEDVLERVVLAHEKMKSDIVVEITGDCPLLDPQMLI